MSRATEQSIKSQVKVIAQKQRRPFNDVWQEVVLERWLARLAKSPYRKNFIFKGAMCLLRYIDIDRETRDLDFLLRDLQCNVEDVHKYLNEVSALDLSDGFYFGETHVSPLEHTHMQYPGYSVSAIGHIGKTRTKIFIDVGVGDVVKPMPMRIQLLTTDKAPLFEESIELWAYPVEWIFAEKLETAIARGNQNSRMKDYHDLVCLIRNGAVEIEGLRTAIAATFSNRGSNLGLLEVEKSETEMIQKYWTPYHRNLSNDTQREMSGNIQDIVEEINQFIARYIFVV